VNEENYRNATVIAQIVLYSRFYYWYVSSSFAVRLLKWELTEATIFCEYHGWLYWKEKVQECLKCHNQYIASWYRFSNDGN